MPPQDPPEQRAATCCFTGHRPGKLPWGTNEADARCAALKESLLREIQGLYRAGYRHFISGMARGADLYFAEAALALRPGCPGLVVEGAAPFPGQADRWPGAERARWQHIWAECDMQTVVQPFYSRWCMQRRNQYMVDRSAAVLSVFDGTPGGTMHTLNYAMERRLDILLLDLNRPGAPAVRLEP